MPVETRILDAIPGCDVRCQNCGRYVKLGEGKTLGYWHVGRFLLFCPKCEDVAKGFKWLEGCRQERV